MLPPEKPKRIDQLRNWAILHRSKLLFATAILVVVGSGATLLAIMYQAPQPKIAQSKVVPKPKPPKPIPKPKSPLTGVEVADEATTKRQVTAIMIENCPDARPQSGLYDAGIVYEAIAEGGITRFLALYQEARPGLIGPVRSVRPYYVEWLTPYDAAVAHIGGSRRALDLVRNGSYKDIDQFFNSAAYWRAKDRYAPHNVYTNFDRLDALNQKKGFVTSTFTGFLRKPDAPSAAPTASTVTVNISGPTYNSTYAYDKPHNRYVRSHSGKPHNDREVGQIGPKVVAVIKVPTSIGFEDGNREQMNTVGSGQAYIFQDGNAIEGTWTKADIKSPIIFKDIGGKEITLNAGQTWITAIAPNKSVTWQ